MAIVVSLLFMLAWSRHGRAIIAIRENEVAADASGVPVTRYKAKAFTIAAFFAGVAGSLYAHSVGVLDPSKFDFNASISYLVMVVFGGMGSFTGSVVSATGLTMVQFAMAKLVEYRQLAYALLLIVMMIFKPTGLLGVKEFSMSGVLARIIPGFRDFMDRFERRLRRRKAGPIMPDVPRYRFDAQRVPVLEMKNLGIRFGGLQAVEDVNVRLTNNEIVGLIGPNGAGKTTVFNLLTGVYVPRRDRCCSWAGPSPASHLRDHQRWHRPDVPEHPAVQVHDGHREHQGGLPEPHVLHHTGQRHARHLLRP
jgi:ABC-type multidrug transport system fused ATPase/permease subunit